jgi:hypothetical protein
MIARRPKLPRHSSPERRSRGTKQSLHIPVYIEIDPQKFEIVSGQRSTKNIQELVARGLRAQLHTVSLVTGQASAPEW